MTCISSIHTILDENDMNRRNITMSPIDLLQNLGNLSSNGVFDNPLMVELVANHLTDEKVVNDNSIHPVNVMIALVTYRCGYSENKSTTWNVDPAIIYALNEMFYLSFKKCTPIGKRIYFCIDCSGSMKSPSAVSCISNADAVALLAMVFSRSDYVDGKFSDRHTFKLFTSIDTYTGYRGCHQIQNNLTDVTELINSKASFNDVYAAIQRYDFGITDISLPVIDALNSNQQYDAFVIITDIDVNSGTHPSVALKEYRRRVPNAKNTKMIVVSTCDDAFSIADSDDTNMLDIVGFSCDTHKIIQDFILTNKR